MKKYISRITTVVMLTLCISFAASAQFIKVRPKVIVNVRPVAPSPRHVWVSGEYAWRGNQYHYTDGYWAEPVRPRAVWVEGRWRHRRGGWVWIPGHWR